MRHGQSTAVSQGEREDPFQSGLLGQAPALTAYANGLSRDWAYAEDLVQDTLVKALQNRDKFADGTNLKAWLFTILRNTFLSDIRRKSREVIDSEYVHSDAGPSSPAGQEGAIQFQEVSAVLAKLPSALRRTLIMVGAEGHTYEDAANLEGCAIGTIKSRVSRARSFLQRATKPTEF